MMMECFILDEAHSRLALRFHRVPSEVALMAQSHE